jgi:hypothetical protein
MKRRNHKSENQLKTQQNVAGNTHKNEINQNNSDLYYKISLYKLKVPKTLQKGGIILFILVVAF